MKLEDLNIDFCEALTDLQAETISGGGVGQELSSEIKDAFALAKSLGYNNFTQFNNAEGFFPDSNVGQIISNRVQELKNS
ncbi:MAG TPA: hypothetical protein V6D26_26325 [Stenomitos sp.]